MDCKHVIISGLICCTYRIFISYCCNNTRQDLLRFLFEYIRIFLQAIQSGLNQLKIIIPLLLKIF